MDETGVLTNQPLIIDNGSGEIKAGFAGDEEPKCFFPSYVGRPKHTRIMAGAVEGETFIGSRAQELRGLLKIRYPVEHGIVKNWDDMERIWSHVYSQELKVTPEEHPVLLTEAPLNPRANRDTAAEVFFETFNVPALFTSIQAVLSLYSSGRATALVLDSGDGVSHTVPIYEGFAITSGIRRVDLAGRDVTEHLALLLRKGGGAVLNTSAEREIVRAIKERHCYVSADVRREERELRKAERRDEFRLPDGNTVRLGSELFRAPEIMFEPDTVGLECAGVHEIVAESIRRADLDLRRQLYSNIVLSGGNTLTRGFGDRLLGEMRRLAPRDTKLKIYAPPERKYSTWIGGSILAGLGTFKKMWVTLEEWRENPDLVHIKCM
ncbi:actin-related protein [Dipodascopsis tothii]|uniref:actin-related protein n=1 Tax=Dipodascopsis tothii TaxID=44089 RepID=UPI0034CE8894